MWKFVRECVGVEGKADVLFCCLCFCRRLYARDDDQ